MKRFNLIHRFFGVVIIGACFLMSPAPSGAAGGASDLAFFSGGYVPNVLVVMDNSNSMDYDFVGNPIGSWQTGSRSMEARSALTNLITTYATAPIQMRIGLMTYKQSAAFKNYYLHSMLYFSRFDPSYYCPNPPAECSDYCLTRDATAGAACRTGCQVYNSLFDETHMDGILTQYGAGTSQRTLYCHLNYPKTNRYPNPTDPSNYIYYKVPGAYYGAGNSGNGFLYSPGYSTLESPPDTVDRYDVYTAKTGTSDTSGWSGQYMWNATLVSPPDEDVAMGFGKDYGRRVEWFYANAKTWYSNSSPGGGYLNVPCADNAPTTLTPKLTISNEANYLNCSSTSTPNSCSPIVNAGMTPTAGTFRSALNYFKGEADYQSGASNTSPIQDWCQKNYIIYVTDGMPSVDESGVKNSSANLVSGVLSRIDALRDVPRTFGSGNNATTYRLDIPTYVLGISLTPDGKTYADQMAIHGGTDVEGHAFYADSAADFATKMQTAFESITSHGYSFSTASVASARVQDENYLYETSFEPKTQANTSKITTNFDPFWKGYVKKYQINTDGSIGDVVWEAGDVLRQRPLSTSPRNIQTLIGGSLTNFTTSNISRTYLGVSTDTLRDGIVNYIQGNYCTTTTTTNCDPDNWRLGDTFHSNPITVGTPSQYFWDFLDTSSPKAFDTFRANHPRTSAAGTRLLITGANDGQLHVFETHYGNEVWSFIPPNLLPKLQYIAHSSHPTSLPHQYFIDGPVTVADVWWHSGSYSDSTSGAIKHADEWHTLGIIALGRNDSVYSTSTPDAQATKNWSSSANCDSGMNDYYTSTYSNYCGYYAFDFTNFAPSASTPVFQWRLHPNSSDAPFFDEPWSRFAIGRVKINGNEKWVGFVGGGYSSADCSGGGSCVTRGKGFFVVDLSNGDILWRFTKGNSTTSTTSTDMVWDLAAAPAAADMDNDGLVDIAFAGDTGGNVWRFDFCKATDSSSCNTSNWTGGLLMDKIGAGSLNGKQPIYTSLAVSKDTVGQIWLHWGTGDKTNPLSNDPAGYIWALKPLLCTPTCFRSTLDNVTSPGNYVDSVTKKGWYINIAGQQEKVVADPVVFGGVVYFSTYTPPQGNTITGCSAGTASLYALNEATGAGAFDGGARSISLQGGGMPSSPIISLKPGSALPVDLYITTSGGGALSTNTFRVNFNPPTLSNRTNMLFWKDNRLQ